MKRKHLLSSSKMGLSAKKIKQDVIPILMGFDYSLVQEFYRPVCILAIIGEIGAGFFLKEGYWDPYWRRPLAIFCLIIMFSLPKPFKTRHKIIWELFLFYPGFFSRYLTLIVNHESLVATMAWVVIGFAVGMMSTPIAGIGHFILTLIIGSLIFGPFDHLPGNLHHIVPIFLSFWFLIFGITIHVTILFLIKELKKKTQLQAQFDLLQAKINPHFLFNTLSAIAGLAQINPKMAENAILRLSDNFRNIFDYAGKQTISLKEELEILNNYMELIELRFQDKIKVKIHNQLADLNLKVPPLIIQPIVENSVKHGLEPKKGKGLIQINIDKEEKYLSIEISDDGLGDSKESPSMGANSGILNLKQRLEHLYGQNATLHFSLNKNGAFTKILLPVETQIQPLQQSP